MKKPESRLLVAARSRANPDRTWRPLPGRRLGAFPRGTLARIGYPGAVPARPDDRGRVIEYGVERIVTEIHEHGSERWAA